MPDDLGQIYSDLKSLPDSALQNELQSPTGMIPGYMIVSELHERKLLRTGEGAADNPKSLAKEYMGAPGQFQGQLPPQGQSVAPPTAQGLQSGIASLASQPRGFQGGGIVTLDPRFDPRFRSALQQYFAANPGLAISSGYRSPARQTELFNASDRSGHWVARNSLHTQGEAADLMFNGQRLNLLPREQIEALHASAGQYGLKFPMSWEDWHVEPYYTRNSLMAGGGNLPSYVNTGVMDASYVADPRSRFLNAIAGPESGGRYNVITGGQLFNDYSRHPNIMVGDSSAAGRYQITNATYNQYAPGLGITDFSPGSQDTLAWGIASDRYKQATGRDLMTTLSSGDTNAINEVGNVLSPTWISLKGKNFAQMYGNAQGSNAQVASVGTGMPGITAQSTQPTQADNMDDMMSLALLGGMFGQQNRPAPPPPQPAQPNQTPQQDPLSVSPYPELLQQRQQRWGTLI